MSDHVHLDEDAVEAATARYEQDDALPDCPQCAAEVSALARHRSLAALAARRGELPAGEPAVLAVKALRRRTFARRAFGEVLSLFGREPSA